MKAYANAITAAIVMFFVALTATAQTTHPDPNAVLIGSYTVSVIISGSGNAGQGFGLSAMSASQEACAMEIRTPVTVWRTSTGQIDYIIDAASITFLGDCDIDLTPSEVLALLSRAAVIKGVQLELIPCTPNCEVQEYSRVYTAMCVRVEGEGELTHYVPCDMTSLCYREYVYCCPNGTSEPDVIESPRHDEGCGSGVPIDCQPTCSSSSILLMQ